MSPAVTQEPGVGDLVEELWVARKKGASVPLRELSEAQAREILGLLLARSLDAGDSVVGWKLGLTSAAQRELIGAPGPFAAPVYTTSLARVRLALVRRPRVEVEFVGRLEGQDGELRFAPDGWAVGIELIDLHLAEWSLSWPWVVADWGVHAGAAIGSACQAPAGREPVALRVTIGDEVTELAGEVPLLAGLPALLEADARGWRRRPRAGDLVWTGSLGTPLPAAPSPDTIVAEVAGRGSARLELAR